MQRPGRSHLSSVGTSDRCHEGPSCAGRHLGNRATRAAALLLVLLGGRIAPVRAITRGADDDSSPEADAVVQLFDSSPAPAVKLCTGTLITPTAVLTAKHCVTGSDSSLGNFSPAQLPFTVSVGNPIVYPIGSGADPLESAPSSNLLSAAVSLYYGNSDPVNSQETGADLAIIWLTKPLFTAAHIVRSDLRSPVPANGDDGEGGVYDVPSASPAGARNPITISRSGRSPTTQTTSSTTRAIPMADPGRRAVSSGSTPKGTATSDPAIQEARCSGGNPMARARCSVWPA